MCNISLFAQIDTVFWFSAPDVSSSIGDTPISLELISYDQASTVTISQPANGGFTPISVSMGVNDVQSVDLTSFLSDVENGTANSTENTGLYISCTNNISAFYHLGATSNKESFSLKGQKALGTNFYTPFQETYTIASNSPSSFSSIEIVATEDNTTVLITPRTAITGHATDASFSITLNKGQTYSAKDVDLGPMTSLSGSLISSNNPIAVTVFDGALENGLCSNTVGDQITSSDYIGKNYIVQKGSGSQEYVSILATQNSTSITIDNSSTTSTLINWGETIIVPISDAINYISTSKPVYIWHVSGNGCDLAGAQIPPTYCAGKLAAGFTRNTADSLGVLLYTRSGFEDQFTLNGNASLITAGMFSPVPGTSGEFVAAKIYFSTADVPVNSHNLIENAGDIFGLGILEGSNGNGLSYSYLSEFTSYPFIDAGNDATVCANTNFGLTGIVQGGSVTGNWTTNGFGSFSSTNSTLLNQYDPSPLDTIVSPIQLILSSTGPCPVVRDTLWLDVLQAPVVNASVDQFICANNSNVVLSGQVSGGTTTGYWHSFGGGAFTADSSVLGANFTPSPSDITNGSVSLMLIATNVGSCGVESDTMTIFFNDGPVVQTLNDTIYTCANNVLTALSGTVSGVTNTGSWISSGSGIFSPDNLNLNVSYQPGNTDITNGQVLIYLESTSNQNCIPGFDSTLIIFTPAPIVDAGINILSCANNVEVTLNGSVTGSSTTGVWTGGNGNYTSSDTDLIASYSPTATEISNGSIVLTLTSTNNGNCSSVGDVIQINFIAPPTANFNFTEECTYDESVFTDFSIPGYGSINSWNWNFSGNGTSTLEDPTFSFTNSGTYDVTLIVGTNNNCFDTITQQVEAFEVPTGDFTFDLSCPNNQILVDFTDASVANSATIDFWHYDFGGQGSTQTQNPTQIFSPNSTYSITQIVGTAQGCYDTTNQILNIPAIPQAGFSYNSSPGLSAGAEFNFINTSSNGNAYTWDLGDGTSSSESDPSNTYFNNGSYSVTQFVYGPAGCADSVTQLITINTVTLEFEKLIPNAISPNADGKNDVWELDFVEKYHPEASVNIFNEWGQLIFESIGYKTPWDARHKGELVPDGNYFYVIQLDPGNTEADIYKGVILVLKSRN